MGSGDGRGRGNGNKRQRIKNIYKVGNCKEVIFQ